MKKETRQAIACEAAKRLTGKEAQRELLPVGETEVDLSIRGKVKGVAIDPIKIAGALGVAPDGSTTDSSGPKPAEIIALIFDALPKTRLRALLAELPKQYAKTKQLPAVSNKLIEDADRLLKQLRTSTSKPKKGNVTFRKDA